MTRTGTFGLLSVALFATACASAAPVEGPSAPPPAAPALPPEPAVPPPAAVAPAPAPAPAPKLVLEDAVKSYVTASTQAWASKDPKKQSALYSADAVVAMPGPKGLEESKSADMERALAGYFAAFPDLKLTYTRVVAKGNVAVAEWLFSGTNEGDFMGQKATKKKVGYRGATVLTFADDGKVKRETVYFDMGTIMGQLGLGPKGQPTRAVEAAPASPTEFHFAKAGESATEAAARTWLTTAAKGDAKALGALATDDIVISSQYMPADTKGKKAFEKETADGAKAFVDQKTTVATCIPAGDVVACEYTWQATWKGAAMGMKPTGKTGTVHSLDVLRIKDGKVAHATAYANGVEFAATFGLMDDKKEGGATPPAASGTPGKPATPAAPATPAPAKK